MSDEIKTISEFDANKILTFIHDVNDAERLIEWMDSLIEENVTMQAALVEGPDETRLTRLTHIASQISVYIRIKEAAKRALDIAKGNKPPERLVMESTEVAVL